MTLEEEILAAADRLALTNSEEGHEDLVGETWAWLAVHEKAEPWFKRLAESALAEGGTQRASNVSSLARALGSCRYLTRTRALAEELARTENLPRMAPEPRVRIAVDIASTFLRAELPGRASAPLDVAASTLLDDRASVPPFVHRGVLELLTKTKHGRAAEVLALSQAVPTNDLYALGAIGRFEARLGQLDRAWARAEALVARTSSLAVLVSDLMEADPQHTDRLRDVLSRVIDPSTRGALFVHAAAGLAKHQDHLASALELLDEGLARVADAAPANRFSALVSASELLSSIGEHPRAARLAHESAEALEVTKERELAYDIGSAGGALARAGEPAAAFRLYTSRYEQVDDCNRAILLRDIAFAFPQPPDR